MYRANNLTKSIGMDSNIPYYQTFSSKSEDELKLLLNIRFNKLIELLFLYDCVYVDRFDFPIVLDQLFNRDKDIATEIVKKGKLSYVDSRGVVTGCTKNKYFSTLSYGQRYIMTFYQMQRVLERKFLSHIDIDLKLMMF